MPEELISELGRQLNAYLLNAWEIYLIKEQGCQIEVREQNLESFEQENHLSLALRVISQKKLGFGYSTDFRMENLKKLVKAVIDRAHASDVDPDLVLPKEQEPSKLLLGIFDSEFSKIPVSQKIEKVMKMERSALEVDSRVKRVRECKYSENLSQVWIINSYGLNQNQSSTFFTIFLSAVAEDKDEAQIASEFDFSFSYHLLPWEKTGQGAGKKAIAKLGARSVPSQKSAVIFSPEVAGEFLDLLSFALSGENLAKNKSWLKGKEGGRLFSEKITIIDDGLFLSGPGCFPFDDEGVNTRKKILMDKGELQGFLFNSYYGNKLKKGSSGNAVREGVAVPPSIAPTNLYLVPGKRSQEEMIKELDRGLLVEEVLGMHTADEISGEFSVGVSGHWIEKGRIGEAVAQVAIAGSLKELFSRVLEVGNDLKFYGPCGSGSILIEELEISGS